MKINQAYLVKLIVNDETTRDQNLFTSSTRDAAIKLIDLINQLSKFNDSFNKKMEVEAVSFRSRLRYAMNGEIDRSKEISKAYFEENYSLPKALEEVGKLFKSPIEPKSKHNIYLAWTNNNPIVIDQINAVELD